ncbi:phospholipase C [Malassezia equina]|uniref:Phospholipase C n=1 Tax=Malassezia equina TaxID=1381935 RepID=A0AAF0EFZ2_9BASI|nr:phospholipase C [Malassezia equina]
MFSFKVLLVSVAAAIAAVGVSANDSNLKQIEHVILFMQENRAFDHYFGTMAGVRGFNDPNVQIKDNGKSIFEQPVNSSVKPKPPKGVDSLMYWYLNQAGEEYEKATDCVLGGTNAWQQNQAAWNKGKNNKWAEFNTPYSIGYFKRKELPVHFAIAEEFLVGDAYYESIISASDTNRAVWVSGTINSPGSPPGGDPKKQGGPVVDDHRAAGCEKNSRGEPMACLPVKWKTIPEYLEEQDISWLVYEDMDNGYHNFLEQFEQYELDIIKQGPLAKRGIYRPGIHKFFYDLKNGSLPQVSYIVPPIEISEHPPNLVSDGAWFQQAVTNALMESDYWNKTVMIVSYDETGGFADHVMAPHAPKNTPGEWMEDPYDHKLGQAPTGPGFRVPFYIVSPWTRKGGVFTEHAAHESQILFLEKWSAAHGKNWTSKEMNPWRREHLSDLMNAFDFGNQDNSVANVPKVPAASKDPVTKLYNGVAKCMKKYKGMNQPPVPYGNQTELKSGYDVEKGYKQIRGELTEGRYLTLETYSNALSHKDNKLSSAPSSKEKNSDDELFVVHWLGHQPKDHRFHLATSAGKNASYVNSDLTLTSDKSQAATFTFDYKRSAKGFQIKVDNEYLSMNQDGSVKTVQSGSETFTLYSVTK